MLTKERRPNRHQGIQSKPMISDADILRKIERQPRQAAGYKQLVRELRIKGDGRQELKQRLADLVRRGKLIANADRFMGSIIAGDHLRTEKYLEQSGVAWTLLRNQIYADGLPDQAEQIVREGKLVTSTPEARVAYVTRKDCAAAAAAVLTTPGHENRAYNITGPDAVGPRELVALASEISGKRIELVALDETAYRKYLLETGTPEAAIDGALSFAAELNSPYLREASTAVKDLTGRAATSVRSLLLASKRKLIAAAK